MAAGGWARPRPGWLGRAGTYLGRPECGHEAGQRALEEGDGSREPDDVWVREQVEQERLHVVQALRPAEVEEEHANALA